MLESVYSGLKRVVSNFNMNRPLLPDAELPQDLAFLCHVIKGQQESLEAALKSTVEDTAEVERLRASNKALNLRAQKAESAALTKLEEVQRAGPSLGRGLANWAASDYKRKYEDTLLQNSALRKVVDALDVALMAGVSLSAAHKAVDWADESKGVKPGDDPLIDAYNAASVEHDRAWTAMEAAFADYKAPVAVNRKCEHKKIIVNTFYNEAVSVSARKCADCGEAVAPPDAVKRDDEKLTKCPECNCVYGPKFKTCPCNCS